MTDLTEALRRRLATPQIYVADMGDEHFEDGVDWENKRFIPIHAALIECFEALEWYQSIPHLSTERSDKAIASVRKALGEEIN